MASSNSIRRALLRPGHFLKLLSDRQLYVSPVQSLGGFSICQTGSHSVRPLTFPLLPHSHSHLLSPYHSHSALRCSAQQFRLPLTTSTHNGKRCSDHKRRSPNGA